MPAPTTAGLYGPSKDFWPKNTLTRAQALALPASSTRRAVVPFTKAAVQTALNGFSDADWDLGCVVFTQAGNNTEGSGAGAGSAAWLATGRSGRKMRTLITPLGDFGSCTFTKSMAIYADGVAFGGYEFIAPKSNGLNRGVLLRGASNSALFNLWPLYYWGVQSIDNEAASTIELVNVVLPEGPLKIYPDNSFDTAAIRTGSNAPITDVLLTGVYEGPSFREKLPEGKKPSEAAHTDSRQISGGSLISNVRQRRSVTWGSTNAAIQSTGALTGYHFEQSLVIGGPSTNKRYPVPEGTDEWRADGSGFVKPNALNGGPTGCTADGLVVIGTVGQFKFTYARDSWLSEAPQGSQQPTTGATWGVDTTLASKPLSWFDTVAPNYTRAQIKAIFDGSSVVVPDDDYPTAPNLAIPAVTTSKVSLSWTAATDAEGPVTYEIERNGELVASVSGLTWENSGLPVATTYQYQVFAVDNADQRTGSNVRTATTGSGTADTTPPTKPELTVTNLATTSGTLNWTAATDDIGVTGYDVMVNGVLAQRVSSSARSLKATGLTPDTDYDVAVIAYDAAGNRTSSDLLEVTTPGTADTVAPIAPTLATPTAGISSIDYSWVGASDDRGVIRDYSIYLNNAAPVKVTGTNYRAENLLPATKYDAYVVAYDPAGNASPASNVQTVTTGTETTPPTGQLSTPAAGDIQPGRVEFRYTAVDLESGVRSADAYFGDTLINVGAQISGDFWGFDMTSSELAGVTSYRVKFTDNAGNSAWSESRSINVLAPAAPDTTPPTGGITDPVTGTVVVPPFQRVKFSASDPQSGISSVSLRTSTLGELATATLVSPGIYEADLPVGSLPYGTTAVFARIVNGVGLSYDSPSINLVRQTPAVTEQGYVEIAPPILNTAGEPVQNGRLTVTQRVRFGNLDGFITKAPIEVEVTEGLFRIDGVTKNIRVAIPPLDKGLEIIEEGSDLPYVKRIVGFPEGTTDGGVIPYKALVDLVAIDQPGDATVPPGVAEALAAAQQVAADREHIDQVVADIELGNGLIATEQGGRLVFVYREDS
ncbi:chitodextrinase [Rathayibacter sp. PhB127]|uniref:fibronectin type III domain-containing protein n=1 Tax=Rathayibacter sp. PhB127 TaxID=2485176 RepID=UPI000FBC9000|nr:fibronectin type III domain-containing protein [Rathayibacter sp. PhB127]ROS28931.1 chitodextrinase [Rathayibacter sp. PhB127]